MDGLKAAGVAVVSVALAGLAAGPALAARGTTVGSLSSLKPGTHGGALHGVVNNASAHAVTANVSVRLQAGTAAKLVARTNVRVPARSSARYRVDVKVPGGLSRGNYYFAACTPLTGGDL